MKNFLLSAITLLTLIVGQVQISNAGVIVPSEDVSIGSGDGVAILNGPSVTIDDATKYVSEKGAILVGFIQNIAKPITVVVMVVSGLLAIIMSLAGGRDGASKWFGSFIVSALCYVAVMFAPMLLQLLVGFITPA